MNPTTNARSQRVRGLGLAIVLWAFSLATTTLLVGLWGRTVTADQSTLEEGSRAALSAEVVADRIHIWLTDAVATTAGKADPRISDSVATIAESPEATRAVDQLLEQIVQAALAEPGTRAAIEVGPALEPLVPIVASELAANGVDIPVDEVSHAIEEAAATVFDTEESSTITGAAYRARAALTKVFVAGLAALLLFGSLAVALAREHLAMIRSLAVRLAVSAVTFTILLRLGSWAMDPSRGRSPLANGGSVVLASNHIVLFVVAAAALCVALSTGVLIRRRRLRGAPHPESPATPDATEIRALVTI